MPAGPRAVTRRTRSSGFARGSCSTTSVGCKRRREAYRDVLANREERHFSSVDRGIFGFKARQNLAVVYTELGEAAAALEQWRLVVREVPGYRAGWRGLCQILFERGTPAEAEPALRAGPPGP